MLCGFCGFLSIENSSVVGAMLQVLNEHLVMCKRTRNILNHQVYQVERNIELFVDLFGSIIGKQIFTGLIDILQ